MPRFLPKTGTGATLGMTEKTPHSPPIYSRKQAACYRLAATNYYKPVYFIRMPRLRRGDIENMPIAVPGTNEQRRIVSKIEALQARSGAARQALDAIPPLLEKFRQSVL